MDAARKPATIRRHLATIARAHRAAELLSPCASEPVRLAVKEMSRAQPARQRQARPFGWSEIKQFLETAGKGIRADRERALLCVAYDTMGPPQRAYCIEYRGPDICEGWGGVGAHPEIEDRPGGEGAVASHSRETARHVKQWVKTAKITEGVVFRRLMGRNVVGPRLHVDMVADIFKRVGRWIGLLEPKLPTSVGTPSGLARLRTCWR
jgi:hypothetical protein